MTLHEDEVPVDEGVVRRLLQRQYPDLADVLVTPVGGGTDNTMYRVGRDHLARFPRTRDKAAALHKELTWLPRLAGSLTQPVPVPVHAGRPGADHPLPWALYRWIDGEEAGSGTVTDWARYGRDLAAFVASLHATDLGGVTRSGDLDWYRGGPLHEQDAWVTSCFTQVRSYGADLDLGRLGALWREALELPAREGPHVWLHGDLKPSNVLVREGRLAAVIDFGALSVGHPDAEHAVTWDLPPTAREAYRTSLGIDDHSWARARAWAIAVGVSGVAYYWRTFPAFVAECLQRLRQVTADPA
jgi:aminoglycoside phosphotransferase (APT) family kinase protein